MAAIPEFLKGRPVHKALEPLSWIIGRWVSQKAHGQYPTISSFQYCEQIEFRSLGQPLLDYDSITWHPEKHNVMHMEKGFLSIKPESKQVALMVAHNFGLTTVEEGCVDGNSITLKSCNVGRMSFTKDSRVLELQRKFNLKGDELEQVVLMQTAKTPLTEHLRIIYKKAC